MSNKALASDFKVFCLKNGKNLYEGIAKMFTTVTRKRLLKRQEVNLEALGVKRRHTFVLSCLLLNMHKYIL